MIALLVLSWLVLLVFIVLNVWNLAVGRGYKSARNAARLQLASKGEQLAECGEQMQVLVTELHDSRLALSQARVDNKVLSDDNRVLKFQLSEATAKNATHAQLPPTRPKSRTTYREQGGSR